MSDLLTINEAAPRLGVSPRALRARCRRGARREQGKVVARLAAGVTALKFGSSWRIRIDALPGALSVVLTRGAALAWHRRA